MADDVRMPGGSWDEVKRIIRAYLSAGSEAGPDDVAKRAALNRTQVSRNNRFLLDLGVLEQGQSRRKGLSSRGEHLARALDHEQVSEANRLMRELIEENEFLHQIVAAVRIRGGMDAESLYSHIAFSAGKPKSTSVATGARAIAAMLEESGVLLDQEGKFVVAAPQLDEDAPPNESSGSFPAHVIARPKERSSAWGDLADWYARGAIPYTQVVRPADPSGVSIAIQIQCTPDDLDDLGPKLRRLLEELSESEENDGPPRDGPAESDPED